jgi:hypothetical protein
MIIYLTEEYKEQLENRIRRLEDYLNTSDWIVNPTSYERAKIELAYYNELSLISIILPVEENWTEVLTKSTNDNYSIPYEIRQLYPNGIIIKSK